MVRPKDPIRFNVGGRIFHTTASTLAFAGRNSFFGAMLDQNWTGKNSDEHFIDPNWTGNSDEHFIDRNPDCFAVLLDLLRTGELHVPNNVPDRLLRREAQFYGLLDPPRATKWAQFDGNRAHLSGSVPGLAPGDGTAIRAGPDGGCCVAHGSIVHVYDWSMEEHKPVSVDFQRVNDVGFVDHRNIAVSASQEAGLALFDAASGELKHKFQVSHKSQRKGYTAGALTFSSGDHRIFSSCRGRSNEHGIGVWDDVTGDQIDFFYDSSSPLSAPGRSSLGEADRIQWLNDKNILLVASLFPRNDSCCISLLDFRDKSVAWQWSDAGVPATSGERRVRDAVAMEGGHDSVCVVDEYEDLGFMDFRRNEGSGSGNGSVRWRSRRRLVVKRKVLEEEQCYPKLAVNGGQLFSSMNDSISVFCGPEWVLTSRLRRGYGGSICDFSIGGDRLFALHSEENVFDVWETPAPAIA